MKSAQKRKNGSLDKAIQKFLNETDWDKFWSDVMEASRSEIEAYELARVKSNFGKYGYL